MWLYYTNPTGIYFFVIWTVIKAVCATFCSATDNLLANILKDSAANEYIDKIRQKRPKPRYGIECYHNVTTRDSKGNTSTRKVVTWTG